MNNFLQIIINCLEPSAEPPLCLALPSKALLRIFLKYGNPKIDGDRLKIGLKSLTAHVYANKNRTKGRTTLLFVSMDSCDPKEVCKYHKYTMETNNEFFRTSQRQTLDQILVLFEDVGTLSKFGSPN